MPYGNPTGAIVANWMTSYLPLAGGPTATFDATTQKFVFSSPIYVTADTTANTFLGIAPGYEGYISESHYPIDLVTFTGIIMKTNLSIHQLPTSGILCHIPVPPDCSFGQRIFYYDHNCDDWSLVMDEQISRLHIQLLRQDGRPLDTLTYAPNVTDTGYYTAVPPWTLTFKIVTVLNPGFIEPLSMIPTVQTTHNLIDNNSNMTTQNTTNENNDT